MTTKRIVLSAAILLSLLIAGLLMGGSLPGVGTGQWVPAAAMSDARDGAASVELQSGSILITGGNNAAGSLPSADIYQTDGTLVQAAPMQSARTRHTATLLQDGRVLVAGGDTGGGAATNAAEIYDPAANTWFSAGTLSTARCGHTATLLDDGRVAIIGGQNAGAPVTSIEIYDPAGNAFSQVSSLNVARTSHAAAKLADGRVLVSGGFGTDANGNPVALNSAEIFDPATGSVSAAGSMNVARGNHGATAVLDGLVVVTGGSDGTNDLASIETYNATANTWTLSAATLSVPRSGHQATSLPANNSVLISGGTSGGTAVVNADDYQPWTDSVISGGAMNAARVAGTGSGLGVEGLYLAAGGSGSNSTELHRFPTIKTDLPDYTPGQQVLMTGTGYASGEIVNLVLAQNDGDPTTTTQVTADGTGNISYQGFAPDVNDVGIHFHLTAIGQTSGLQAQTTFTDGNATSVSGTVKSSATGNPAIVGATITCTSGCNNTPAASTTSGAGGAYVFNNTTTKLSFNTNGPVSITLTASASGFNSASISFPLTNGETLTGENFTLTPSIHNTSTSVACAPNPDPVTAPASCTATVTDTAASGATTPTGSVSFTSSGSGAFSPGTSCTLSGSGAVATCSVNYTPASGSAGTSPTITGSYGGDSTHNPSGGSALLTVAKANSTTQVTSSANPSVFGQSVTFTATVTPNSPATGTPGGTVNFFDNGNPIGSGTLSGGVASASTSALSVGNHAITATYNGDGNFNTSNGSLNTNPQVVNKANSSTAVSSSLNPSTFGQPVTFTATVTAVVPGTGTPSGTVTFLDGGNPIGTGALSGGAATFSTASLSAGNHTITATYNGDGNFNTSTGSLNTNPQVVNKSGTTTSLASSVNPSAYGQPVTFSVTVSPVAPGSGTPTGSVQLLDNGAPIATTALSSGSASFLISNLSVGAHPLTAQYLSDPNFSGSTSAAVSQSVNPAPTVTTITSLSASSGEAGVPVTVNFSVSSQAPSATIAPDGSVNVSDGADTCSGTLIQGAGGVSTGSCALTPSTTGTKSIVASYPGDGNFGASASTDASYMATPRPTTTAIILNPVTVVVGESSNVSVTVADNGGPGASTPQGTVSFSSSDATDSFDSTTCTLSGGTCSVNVTVHEVGVSPHIVTASYTPNDNIHAGAQAAWTVKTAMPQATEDFGVDTINGKIYTAGGEVANDCFFTTTLRIYDPVADSWSTGANMPTHRRGLSAAAINGKLYAVGGDTGCGLRTGANEAYDPVANSWNSEASMLTPRTLMGVGVINGILYTVGGLNSSNVPVATVEAYDPTSNTWTAKASMPTAREGAAVAVVNGKLYAISGTAFPLVNTVEVYDPNTDTWSTKAPIPTARANAAAGVVGGIIYVIGGNTGADSSVVEAYDPASDTWSSQPSMPTARTELGGATVNGAIYAIGGNTGTYSAANEAFTPAPGSTAALTVNKADTSTAVTSSSNPSVFGQSVTFTATVSPVAPGAGTPGGTVTFLDGGNPIGSGTLTGGIATFTTSALAVGNHTITTNYGGDANFNTNTGSLTGNPQVVNKADTSTTVTSSVNPSVFGQPVTFTATVSAVAPGAGTATGTVTFLDGGNPIGSGTLIAGVASFATSALAVGNHTITTSYGGDGNFNGSGGSLTGNPQAVNKADTSTAVTSSVNPSVFGQSITFTATVSAVAPGSGTATGTVTFLDGGSPVGSGVLSGGIATFTTSALAVGNHTITTNYGGDGNFNGSTGSLSGNPQVVNKADTSTTVTSSVNPSVFGQSITFTATVSAVAPGAGTATGTVTFLDGGNPIGSGTLIAGIATFTTSALSVGNHTITTSYGGDGNFNGSNGSLTGNPQVVNKADTSTAVTSSVNPSVFGQSITFTATVSAVAPGSGTATGTVTFLDGGNPIGSGTLAAGIATFTTSALSVGNHTITTSYGGDPNFNGSNGSLTGNPQVVNKADTTSTVTSSLNPSIFGQGVTFTATISPVAPGAGTPTGTVTFLDGGSPIGTGGLSGGVATFATSALSAGNHTITTNYGGDGSFNGSTGSLTGNPQVVNKADTTTTITANVPNPSVVGQAVSISTTVTVNAPGSGTPTGTVTVSDGVGETCTITLSGGTGSCSLTPILAGTDTLTAHYNGDSNFNASSSAGVTQTVNKADTTTTITTNAPNPSVVGQAVSISATVAVNSPGAGTPAGTVTVSDGVGETCTITLSSGTGSCSLTPIAAGTDALTAHYNGNSNFNASTSAGAPQTVNKANTTTTVTSSTNPSSFGQSVTFTATVSVLAPGAGSPTGTVTFLDGGSPIGSGTVSGGIATYSTTSLAVGNHTITANYGGDPNFNVSAGSLNTNPQVVNKAATTTVITSVSPEPSVLAASYLVKWSVTPAFTGTPTGTVTVNDGNGNQCSAAVGAGQCTMPTSTSAGTKTLTASYSGDGNFNSSSGTQTHQVIYATGGTCDGDLGHTILQPINADGSSTFKQGSTVPAKFRVCDANGNSIGTPGVVSSFDVVSVFNGTITTTVDETVDSTTPDTAFRWDSTNQQWIFNISTKTLSVHDTYGFRISLNDGSTINFQFGLPK